MCGIFGSFDSKRLASLAKANAYRGQHSHSITLIRDSEILSVTREFGPFPEIFEIPDDAYALCHIQAPTSSSGLEKDPSKIHPSQLNGTYLWHNGILTFQECLAYNEKHGTNHQWDTRILHEITYGGNSADDIDGTFSCLYYGTGGGLFAFRNAAAPMFIDPDNLDVSSVKALYTKKTDYNVIYHLNLSIPALEEVGKFNNQSSPYYIP